MYFHFYVQTAVSLCCSISTQKLYFKTKLCWKLNLSLLSVKWSYIVWWIIPIFQRTQIPTFSRYKIVTVDHEMQKNKEQEYSVSLHFCFGKFSFEYWSSRLLWNGGTYVTSQKTSLEYSGTLGFDAMWLATWLLIFQRKAWCSPTCIQQSSITLEDESNIYLKSAVAHTMCDIQPYSVRLVSSVTLLWKPQNPTISIVSALKTSDLIWSTHIHIRNSECTKKWVRWYGTVVYMQLHLQFYPDS